MIRVQELSQWSFAGVVNGLLPLDAKESANHSLQALAGIVLTESPAFLND